MAQVKLLLSSNKIYHHQFEGSKPGYDALAVDSFLDIVIKDYDAFSQYQVDVKAEIDELNSKIRLLTEQLSNSEAENAQLKNKLSGIAANENVSLNNLELLKRIANLEFALKKAGINPNTID